MYPTRAIALSTLFCGILCTPLFVFAQTTPPQQTQAEIKAEADAAYQEALKDPRMQDALRKAAEWEKTAAEEVIRAKEEEAAAKEEAAKATESAKKVQKDYNTFIEEKTREIMLSPEDIQKKTLSDYLDVKISPQSPGPSEQVTIVVESYLADLQKALVKWSVNGKTVSQGIGRTTFIFQNGLAGKTTLVSVSISTNTGSTISRDFSFTPVGVTILWEANTYTPPFYKGKALMVPQAQIRIAAVPDIGSSMSPFGGGDLVYTWEKNSLIDERASGYGKNVFSFTGPTPFNEMDVRVSVSSFDDTMRSETRVFVPLTRPFILFYEKHPLLGVWYNKPIGTEYTLQKKEVSLSAEPYFFSSDDSEEATHRYSWSANGQAVANAGRTITLRNDTGAKGDSKVSLAMRGISKTFQNASRDLNIHFTDEGGSGGPTF